jgi:predicted nuclease of predicted toxin-antitoxin system
MKLLVDMNLSPAWVPYLLVAGIESVHWSTVGDPRAKDSEVMAWARQNQCVLFTHDLDFGTLLANTRSSKPSVIQVRTQEVTPDALGAKLIVVLRQFETALNEGALVTIDERRARVRILPLS